MKSKLNGHNLKKVYVLPGMTYRVAGLQTTYDRLKAVLGSPTEKEDPADWEEPPDTWVEWRFLFDGAPIAVYDRGSGSPGGPPRGVFDWSVAASSPEAARTFLKIMHEKLPNPPPGYGGRYAVLKSHHHYPGTGEYLGTPSSRHSTAAAAWRKYDSIQKVHRRANPGSHLNIQVVEVDTDLGDRVRGHRIEYIPPSPRKKAMPKKTPEQRKREQAQKKAQRERDQAKKKAERAKAAKEAKAKRAKIRDAEQRVSSAKGDRQRALAQLQKAEQACRGKEAFLSDVERELARAEDDLARAKS